MLYQVSTYQRDQFDGRSLRLRPTNLISKIAFAAFVLTGSGLGSLSYAQSSQIIAHRYDIPAGPLSTVLPQFAAEAGIFIAGASQLGEGKFSEGLRGNFSVEEGLSKVLKGSTFSYHRTGDKRYSLIKETTDSGRLPDITVRASGEEDVHGSVSGYLAKRSASGTKTDTSIIETPQSISVLTADRVEAIGAVNLKDALAYTPGIGVSPYGTDSRFDWVTVRGFDAYSPGFYLDGLPMRNVGNLALWRTENYGAERIEILRGPSSGLYGQGNPGGVVNVISKLPTEVPVRELKVQIGSHQRKQVAGDFAGTLNDDGTLLYRITGVVRNAELPVDGMRDDRAYLAPSLTWRPSDQTKVTLMAQFGQTKAGIFTRVAPAYGSLLATPAGTHISSSKYLGYSDFNRFDQDQNLLGYQAEHRIDEVWTVRQKARISRIQLDSAQLISNGYVAQNGNVADPENYRYLSYSPYLKKEKVSSLVVDNQAQADFQIGKWQHTILFGLDYQRTRLDQMMIYGGTVPLLDVYASQYSSAGVTLDAPSVDGVGTSAQTGLYVQDQIKYEQWRLTLAGRLDKTSSLTKDRLNGGAQTRINDSKFTGRTGLVYLLPHGWAPYVSYSESFAPTDTINSATGTPFKSETGRQYEVGVRYQPADGKSLYSAAIFDLRRQNYLSYDVSGMARQTGDVAVRGLELEAMTSLSSRLNVTAAYSYTPYAKVLASANPSLIGTQPTAVPVHRASMWIDYRFQGGFKIGSGVRYEGGSMGIDSASPAKIPAYTLVDAMAGYDIGRWSIALNIQNLTDKTYITTCSSSSCYYGSQRVILATAGYRW